MTPGVPGKRGAPACSPQQSLIAIPVLAKSQPFPRLQSAPNLTLPLAQPITLTRDGAITVWHNPDVDPVRFTYSGEDCHVRVHASLQLHRSRRADHQGSAPTPSGRKGVGQKAWR